MDENYFCRFTSLDVKPSTENGLTDVVKNIHWIYGCTDENMYTDSVYGVLSLPEANSEIFVPFEELTNSQVETWFFSILNEENLKAQVQQKKYERLNPKLVQKSPPWTRIVASPPPEVPEPAPIIYTNQEIKEMAQDAVVGINDKIEEINFMKTKLENLLNELNSAN